MKSSNANIWGYTAKEIAAVLWQKWRLVNGNELYDISADPGQMSDVAASHPELTGRLHDHYEQWWSSHAGYLEDYQRIALGSDKENPIRLCSADWAWAYADNQANIRGCVMESGTWHVDIAKEGRYELTLRRWPEESHLSIAASAPVMQGVDGSWPEGKALPVSSAWLRAGREEQTCAVPVGETKVTFEMKLGLGPLELKSWWYDAEGNQLAGAYYLTAKRMST